MKIFDGTTISTYKYYKCDSCGSPFKDSNTRSGYILCDDCHDKRSAKYQKEMQEYNSKPHKVCTKCGEKTYSDYTSCYHCGGMCESIEGSYEEWQKITNKYKDVN